MNDTNPIQRQVDGTPGELAVGLPVQNLLTAAPEGTAVWVHDPDDAVDGCDCFVGTVTRRHEDGTVDITAFPPKIGFRTYERFPKILDSVPPMTRGWRLRG